MLHIVNGDCTADVLAETTIAGDVLVWRESLATGPALSSLARDEWIATRSSHLAASYGADRESCATGLLAQERALDGARSHDEIVLWFEADLFCQVPLAYLLGRLAALDLGRTAVSLVCPGDFPGRPDFRGLGELEPGELASLFPARAGVTPETLAAGLAAWEAYASPDPRAIEQFLNRDSSALPFAADALAAHLERFPDARSGLGRVEAAALAAVAKGASSAAHRSPRTFAEVFSDFWRTNAIYGFGDAQVWDALAALATCRKPLVEAVDLDSNATTVARPQAAFAATDTGLAVLAGEADHVALNGVDTWLGGARLCGTDVWRWHSGEERLVR